MAMSLSLVACLSFLVIVYWICAVFIYMWRREEQSAQAHAADSCCAGTRCCSCGKNSVCRRTCQHFTMFACGIGLVRTNVGVPFTASANRGFFAGRLVTAVLLAGTAVLLSPALLEIFSPAGAGDTGHAANHPFGSSSELCGSGEIDVLIAQMHDQIEELTHLTAAWEQHNLTVEFGAALQQDVALYGEQGHACLDLVSGRPIWKETFHTAHPTAGEFFPGWCKQASDSALVAARSRTCEATGAEVCVCKHTQPQSPI